MTSHLIRDHLETDGQTDSNACVIRMYVFEGQQIILLRYMYVCTYVSVDVDINSQTSSSVVSRSDTVFLRSMLTAVTMASVTRGSCMINHGMLHLM